MVAALRARLAGADFSVEVIDVDADPALEKQFGEWVPVLFANGERLCHYHLDALKVDEYLRNFG
jgi:thioredoxin reductase (NADPH)